jgi:hypothetical protein
LEYFIASPAFPIAISLVLYHEAGGFSTTKKILDKGLPKAYNPSIKAKASLRFGP